MPPEKSPLQPSQIEQVDPESLAARSSNPSVPTSNKAPNKAEQSLEAEEIAKKQPEQKAEATPIPKDIVAQIYQALEARRFQGALPVTIKEGWRNTLFKAIPGQEPEINNITPKQLALLQKAFEDPQGLKGSIRIYVGKEKIFHVDSNRGTVFDKLGLIPEAARLQAIEQFSTRKQPSEPQEQPDRNVQPVRVQPARPEEASLKEQIDRLQALVEQQQQQIELLTARLDKFVNSPVISKLTAVGSVGEWTNKLHAKIAESGQTAVRQASQELDRNKKTLVSKLREFVRNFQDRASQKFSAARERVSTSFEVTQSSIKQQVGDRALKVVETAVKTVVNNVGERSADGSTIFHSPASDRSYRVMGDRVTVSERAAIDPQSMWSKYSQGVEAQVPGELTLTTIQNAVCAGEARQNVLQMLSADPEVKRIQNARGAAAAKQYSELAFARVSKSLEAAERQQPQKQPARQAQTETEA